MAKYELIPEKLMREGVILPEQLIEPQAVAEEILRFTHNEEYCHKVLHLELSPREMRQIGFPLSKELVLRELMITQGTIDCCHYALSSGVSLNVAGGTHHAFAGKGEGFCIFNDFAVAANYLLKNSLVKKILVVDLDVHQGNGTASIFRQVPEVFTFSMHGKDNYPLHKEISDLDIELETGCSDSDYLGTLYRHLPSLMDTCNPDFVFYLCGADILETDKLGKLGVSMQGALRRDIFVFEQCKQRNIPVVAAMGGGYSPRISDIVEAHCNTFKAAANIFF